jgi:putative phosphoesterase
MRIGLISDLHVDLNGADPQALAGHLAATARARGLELLLIAGDLSNRWDLTLRTLEEIQGRTGLRVLFVAGNHDLWNEATQQPFGAAWGARDSHEALKAFPGNLARGPVELPGGWSVAGAMGWYDFGFGHPRYSTEDFERMRLGDRLWQDKANARWDRPTLEVHRAFLEELEVQLSGLRGRRLILATHVVPVVELTVRPPDELWEYLNAFLGSPEYGELAARYGVEIAVCGHVHYRRRHQAGGTLFIASCLGYSHEWPDPADLAGEVERSLAVVDLPAGTEGPQAAPQGPGALDGGPKIGV